MTTVAMAQYASGGDFAPDGPPRFGGMTPVGTVLQNVVVCATEFARDTLLPIGRRLFASLALIAVVWTGIQVMFAGSFTIGEIISLVFLIGFPFAVLESYATPVGTPWGDMTFPDMVVSMGDVVGSTLVASTFEALNDTVADIAERLFSGEVLRTVGLEAASDTPGGESAASGVTGMFGSLFDLSGRFLSGDASAFFSPLTSAFEGIVLTWSFLVTMVLTFLLLLVPAVVGYASYLWGYVSFIVAIILGPLLVPWILIPQLSFLAWGWFRALLGAAVHMIVASVCFAVAAQLIMVPLVRFGSVYLSNPGQGAENVFSLRSMFLGTAGSVFIESAPLILIAWLGVFKIGEIANFIMSSGPMPQSGLSDRLGGVSRLRSMGASARTLGGAGRIAGSAAAVGGGRAAGSVAGGAVAGPVGVATAHVGATGAQAGLAGASRVLSQRTRR